jgi:pimeloyl-ACP methyl ester carboxylesterase
MSALPAPTEAAPDAVRHGWLAAGGRTLHHLRWGRAGAAAPVVCVHGVTSCAWVWHHVARHLAVDGEVVALDLRGHGASGWAPPDAYRTVDHAEDVAVAVEHLGGPVELVGSSWGALVALAVAVARPELVRRLVLVDVEPSFDDAAADAVPARPESWASLADAVAWWGTANPHAPADLLAVVAAGATRPGPDGSLVAAHDPLFARRWPFRDEDWWDALGAVRAPTLVVSAGQSWVRPEVCDQMAHKLPDAARCHLDRSTHVVPVDAPGPLAAAVAGFVRSP